MNEDRLYFETASVTELCGCVSTALTDSEQGRLSRAITKERKDALMERFLESSRDRSYDADCHYCDAGIKHQLETDMTDKTLPELSRSGRKHGTSVKRVGDMVFDEMHQVAPMGKKNLEHMKTLRRDYSGKPEER